MSVPDNRRVSWSRMPLGKFCKISSGGTPERKVARYWSGGTIPWVTTAEINYRRIEQAQQYITEEGLRNSSAKLLPSGTVLVALYGQGKTRGRVATLGVDAATNQACAALMPDSRIAPQYLYHYLVHSYQVLRQLSNAGGQQNLSAEILSNFVITVPPAFEQRQIADMLSTWECVLDRLLQQFDAKQTLFAALRESLTSGSRRLEPFKKTWPVVALGDLLKPNRERVGPNAPLRVYSVTKDGLVPQDEHFKKRIANEDISRHMVVRGGHFALSGLNFWLGSVDVHLGSDPICISPDYRVFRIECTAEPKYFKYVARTTPFLALLKNAAVERASAVRKNFDRETFFASEIKLPALDEQQAIVSILDDGERELSLLEAEYSALKRQRDSLATQLLTGRLRVGQGRAPSPKRS